jgi:hypothetical protein
MIPMIYAVIGAVVFTIGQHYLYEALKSDIE